MTISAYQLDQSPKLAFDFFPKKSALNQRAVMRFSITEDLDVGSQEVIPEKETFFEGLLYLQDRDTTARDDLGGVFAAAPLRTRGLDPTKLLGPNVEALPIRDRDAAEDDRWAPTLLDGPGLFWPCGLPPGGTLAAAPGQAKPTRDRQAASLMSAPVAGQHPGLVVRGSEERSQHLLFAPTWGNLLTSSHRGRRPSLYSTLLSDVDGDDLADGQGGREHWMSSLDTGLMVAPTYREANPAKPGDACATALFWGNEPWQDDGAGRGLFASHGPFGRQALSYAFAADSGGGPITCGGGVFDKHAVFVARDGRLISQGHLWLGAPWFADEERDAPPEVDPNPYEPPDSRGRPWKTYLRYNPLAQHATFGALGLGGTAPGLFAWETYVPLYMPPDPPPPPLEDPPIPSPPINGDGVVIPFPEGSGSTVRPIPLGLDGQAGIKPARQRLDSAQKWGIRSVLHSYMESASSAQGFRARHTGLKDLRYRHSPSQGDLDMLIAKAPMALRFDVVGAQRGSTWDYTQKPRGRSRYEAGTVSGGLWFMPPELDSDLAGEASLPATSTSYLGLWESRLALGTPRLTGGLRNGFSFRIDGDGYLTVAHHADDGSETDSLTLTDGQQLEVPFAKFDDYLEHGAGALSEAGFFGATPVTQPAAISTPSGGVLEDAEARDAISAILTALRNLGLIAT